MDDQFTFDEEPEMRQLKRNFDRAKLRLKEMIPPVQFDKFIKSLELTGREEHLVFVAAPGKFVQEWVRDKYRKQLETALCEESGELLEIVLEARLRERQADDRAVSFTSSVPTHDSQFAHYTFDNFVIGESNRIACKGCQEVSKKLGKFCNPLYIFGPTGVGKTHLAWATYNLTQKQHPRLRVEYMTAHEFSQRFVVALKAGTIPQFHRSFESCRALIIDDIAFVERGQKFQEEMFHLFNAFVQDGRQLVLCADRAPRNLMIDERLRSRMESGLVADILPPDTDLRYRILRKKADNENLKIDDEVCEFLAANVPGNVRTLLGAFTTLMILSGIGATEPTVELAKSVIAKQFGRDTPSLPTAEQIIDVVAKDAGVSREELIGPSRNAWLAQPRHLAMFLIRENLNESWKHIGARFSNRDHSTVIHAHRKIGQLLASDEELRAKCEHLRRQLGLDRD